MAGSVLEHDCRCGALDHIHFGHGFAGGVRTEFDASLLGVGGRIKADELVSEALARVLFRRKEDNPELDFLMSMQSNCQKCALDTPFMVINRRLTLGRRWVYFMCHEGAFGFR
jgi:hypothetical protein